MNCLKWIISRSDDICGSFRSGALKTLCSFPFVSFLFSRIAFSRSAITDDLALKDWPFMCDCCPSYSLVKNFNSKEIDNEAKRKENIFSAKLAMEYKFTQSFSNWVLSASHLFAPSKKGYCKVCSLDQFSVFQRYGTVLWMVVLKAKCSLFEKKLSKIPF